MLKNWQLVMYCFSFNVKTVSAGNNCSKFGLLSFFYIVHLILDGKIDTPLPISDFGQIEYVIQHNLYRQQVYPSGSNIECIIVIYQKLHQHQFLTTIIYNLI